MLFMIWPCNGQVFFNEIDCYIYIYFYLFTHVTESFVTERLVTESWGLLLAPPPYFSVSCLKRFPDTPRIYTMVLQGFISIVSLSPLLSNLHRRILRSAIIACALQKKKAWQAKHGALLLLTLDCKDFLDTVEQCGMTWQVTSQQK